jgi:hypothetical protein
MERHATKFGHPCATGEPWSTPSATGVRSLQGIGCQVARYQVSAHQTRLRNQKPDPPLHPIAGAVELLAAVYSSRQTERNHFHRKGCEVESKGQRKERSTMLLLIIILLLVLGGGGGYYGHSRWGYGGGAGIGLGTILLILLLAYMLGVFH